MSPEIVGKGIKLSWPIFKSGYSVMISSKLIAGDTWAFSQALAWNVWLLLGITSVVVAFLVAFMERFTLGDAANKRGAQLFAFAISPKRHQLFVKSALKQFMVHVF